MESRHCVSDLAVNLFFLIAFTQTLGLFRYVTMTTSADIPTEFMAFSLASAILGAHLIFAGGIISIESMGTKELVVCANKYLSNIGHQTLQCKMYITKC